MKRGKNTLSPNSAITEGLEDVRKGRVHGPFDTAEEMLASLKGKRGKRLSPEERKGLQRLAARPDFHIDLTDIPEVQEIPSDAETGKFYRRKRSATGGRNPA
jgi:hypothetical protein